LIALRRSLAADTIGAFKFDLAVIGCSAIDAEGDFLDFDIQKVGVSQAVLRQSRRAYLVADRSKLKRTVPARIALLADIDMLFPAAGSSRIHHPSWSAASLPTAKRLSRSRSPFRDSRGRSHRDARRAGRRHRSA
jgi:hypothetical protein